MAAGIALPACSSAPAPTTPPLTKIEARQIGEDAAEKRVLDQLGDVLIPDPFPDTRQPRRPLRDMWFWTRPRATSYADVCEVQRVIVDFESVGQGNDAFTEERAVGLSVFPAFHFLTPPASPYPATIGEDDRRRLKDRCAGLDPDRDAFVSSDGAQAAITGMFAFQEVVRQAVAGEVAFELDCSRGESGVTCLDTLADVTKLPATSIDRCVRYDVYGGCWSIRVQDLRYGLTILTLTTVQTGAPRTVVDKVIMNEFIVLSHPRID
jgi:hypothetical protein